MIPASHHFKRMFCTFLILVFTAVFLIPLKVQADEDGRKVIKAGWFESSYCISDEQGRRSGYSYEYQLKLSAYNGWTYEYTEGSWAELLEMLKNGEIDLLSDVSYTPEREEYMYFSSLPMGTEEYFLFKAPGNHEISAADPSCLNGKKVGVNKGSVQKDFFLEWAEASHVECELIEVTTGEDETLKIMENGTLDAYVTVDSFQDASQAVPVFKIGSSDYFFAVSKNRPDLLADLNFAMSRIQDENRYFNSEMFEKYLRGTGANGILSADETIWLSGHGPIRVGYQDNYLAFCTKDKETGELTGVLKDYLELASDCIPNAHLEFEAVAYPTCEDAIQAMKRGEVDCVFPANFTGYEAEMQNMVMTPALMDTEMFAIVRMSDPNIFAKQDQIIAAVNAGNPNYDAFLADHFPAWGKAYFKDSDACLQAIASKEADCFIISNYRYNNLARKCTKLHLTTFSIGVQMDYCFALEQGRTELYSILAKTTVMIPNTAVDAAISRYITEDAKLTFADFIADHLAAVIAVVTVVLLIILVLLLQNMRAVRTAKSLISATERDDLTGLYTRKYFFQYAEDMYRSHPEIQRDAIVFNIEQFHAVNALYGRDLGDLALRSLGNEARAIAGERNGIAGRFEADSFDLYCVNRNDFDAVFDRLQACLDLAVPKANLRIRMGVMPGRENAEPIQLFDMAQTACSISKNLYNRHLSIYDESVREKEHYEHRLVSHLRQAIDDQEFEVFYQPKFNIQKEPPELISCEALVRWHHPELGMIPPGDFIPLFEKNGLIGRLDKHVWSLAARKAAYWRDTFGVHLPVSVNLSRVDVFDPGLEETLNTILEKSGLDHSSLKLEVTESAYTENADQVIQVISHLRSLGYEVEMDDFGTGYSSLNMLADLPIDVLKMDQAFIRNIEHDAKSRQLVALIIDIADKLNVPVVAEGVETEAQLQELKKMGCAIVQGYYFSKPLTATEFEQKYFHPKPE